MSKKQAIRDMTLAISKLPESATLSDLSRLLFSLADALEAPHLARIAELEVAIEAHRSELSKIADAADCGKLDSGRFAFAIDDVRDALDEGLENDD